MIIEVLIAGVTIIFTSSIVFANVVIKRQRQWDLEDLEEVVPNFSEVEIEQFIDVRFGVPCPKCAQFSNSYTERIEKPCGLRVPFACNDSTCPAFPNKHLHIHCASCNSFWYIRPADVKK